MRLLLSASLITATGCNAITGVDDYQFTSGSGSGGAAVSTSGTADTSTSTGGCGLDAKLCGDTCVALDDPLYGCDLAACDPCGPMEACCPGCTNVFNDPARCGACNVQCADDEWCLGLSCACRPGFVPSGTTCVDPLSNPNDCGGNGPCGGATPLCESGACVASCAPPNQPCEGSCVDTSTSALHCGGCNRSCDAGKLCAGNDCVAFQIAEGCASCPCPSCSGDFQLCCSLAGTAVCVKDASACP